jgi:hypothetical protein
MSAQHTLITCPCGAAQYATDHRPLMRAVCHCTICQRYNQADCADISVFYARHITTIADQTVAFAAHKNPPFVLRGTCAACNAPALEQLRIPLMPRLTIVPTRNLSPTDSAPTPSMHIFYDRRKQDVSDNLPKHHGYLASQTAFSIGLLRAMRAHRA